MTTVKEIREVLQRGGRFHYGALRDIAELAGCSTEHVKNVLLETGKPVAPYTYERIFTHARNVATKLQQI